MVPVSHQDDVPIKVYFRRTVRTPSTSFDGKLPKSKIIYSKHSRGEEAYDWSPGKNRIDKYIVYYVKNGKNLKTRSIQDRFVALSSNRSHRKIRFKQKHSNQKSSNENKDLDGDNHSNLQDADDDNDDGDGDNDYESNGGVIEAGIDVIEEENEDGNNDGNRDYQEPLRSNVERFKRPIKNWPVWESLRIPSGQESSPIQIKSVRRSKSKNRLANKQEDDDRRPRTKSVLHDDQNRSEKKRKRKILKVKKIILENDQEASPKLTTAHQSMMIANKRKPIKLKSRLITSSKRKDLHPKNKNRSSSRQEKQFFKITKYDFNDH